MIRGPTNLLYANSDSQVSTHTRKAKTRKVRSRVSAATEKIGVIDLSAKAGLLFNVLEKVNRKQSRYTFYPVEAPLPMGLGRISKRLIPEIAGMSVQEAPTEDLLNNVISEDFFPLLKRTREVVGVDRMVGLVGPMLAWSEDGDFNWNFFLVPDGDDVLVSAFEIRDFAHQAHRSFEAAMAMLVVRSVWALNFNIPSNLQSVGCIFDFCEQRSDLISVLRRMEISPACLDRIPHDERENVQKCLEAIREYSR
jgi:hypothetical protein